MRTINVFACGFCLACSLALLASGDLAASGVNLFFAAVNAIFAFWKEEETQ